MRLTRARLSSQQVGGAKLLLAAALMFAGAALANFALAPGGTDFGGDPAQMAEAIAANPSTWRLAKVLILVAIILTAVGLAPIRLDFNRQGRGGASAGLVTLTISAVLGSIRRVVSNSIDPWIAAGRIGPEHPTAEAFPRFDEAIGA